MGTTDTEDSTDPSNFKNYQLYFHDRTLGIDYHNNTIRLQPIYINIKHVEVIDLVGIKNNKQVDIGEPDAEIYYAISISYNYKDELQFGSLSYSTLFILTDGEKYWHVRYPERKTEWEVLRPHYLFGPIPYSYIIGAINVYQSCILKV